MLIFKRYWVCKPQRGGHICRNSCDNVFRGAAHRQYYISGALHLAFLTLLWATNMTVALRLFGRKSVTHF